MSLSSRPKTFKAAAEEMRKTSSKMLYSGDDTRPDAESERPMSGRKSSLQKSEEEEKRSGSRKGSVEDDETSTDEGGKRKGKPILKRGGSFQQLLNYLPEIVAPEPSSDLQASEHGRLAQWEVHQYKVPTSFASCLSSSKITSFVKLTHPLCSELSQMGELPLGETRSESRTIGKGFQRWSSSYHVT